MTPRSNNRGWSFDECCLVGTVVVSSLIAAIFLLMPLLVVQQ